MNYIVLDLEYNQPYNFRSGGRTVLEPRMPFEVIQIGAVKLDDELNVVRKFNAFIKPQVYVRLHPIVEKMTGITSEKLENCPSFFCAFNEFTEFIGSNSAVLCSWGADDIKSLFRNIAYHKCNHENITKNYINIQETATKVLSSSAGNSIGLKTAVELLEIPEKAPFHDALNDAYYTSLVFQKLSENEFDIKIFNMSNIEPKKSVKIKTDTKALLSYFETSLDRQLTGEEIAMIKTAYKLGQKKAYDINITK